jgi:hypothetical protein
MAQSSTDSYSVNAVLAQKAILGCFEADLSAFIWGPPGIGKSELVAKIAEEGGGHIIDMRMAQMEPTDLRGIPFFNQITKKMDWADPSELPSEELASKYPFVILFLDEMNSAPSTVQGAAYQLILNGRIGTYVKPKNVRIVAAGNRDSDRGVTYRMPMPLANRFIHIEMKPDFASWQEWAMMNDVHQDVVSYLSYAKQHMYDFDAKSSSKAFATPRSWGFVSKFLYTCTDPETLYTLVAGSVGEGLATSLMAHRKIASKLPNAADILSGKVTTLETKEISAQYSLTVSLCYEMKDITDNKRATRDEFNKIFDNFLGYMLANFEPDLIILGGRTALKTYKLDFDVTKLTNFETFHKKYGRHILSAVKK